MHPTEISKVPADGIYMSLNLRSKKTKKPKGKLNLALNNHEHYYYDLRVYKANPGDLITGLMDKAWIGTWKVANEEKARLHGTLVTQTIYQFKWRDGKKTDELANAVFNHDIGTKTSIDGDLIHSFTQRKLSEPDDMTRIVAFIEFIGDY